jgi:thioredoxin reductase (NADPH)
MVREAELGEEIMRALILRRVSLMETGGGGTVIVGPGDDADVVRLTGFLTRNVHPYTLLDSRADQAAADVIARFQLTPDQLPAVICPGGKNLKNPTETELATCLGLLRPLDPAVIHDAVIVGAGPAGLATAVYAASEGLKVLMIDQRAHGGQAGASARIENYFGFPTGISGHALVSRAYNQAQKFGVETAIPAQVVEMDDADPATGARFQLSLADGQTVLSQSVVIASGVRYRKPAWRALPDYEGSSAHFWASPIEARLCAGQEVVLVGAGNSAGQAVVYLSRHASKVWMLCRSAGLAESMSQYLVDRIEALDNVEILARTQVVDLEGEHGVLQALSWQTEGQAPERHEIRHVFIFTGAEPNTDWLARCEVRLDSKGFVLTGQGVDEQTLSLETSVNGIFAIGDVRSGSTKRVASAVGEGAQVVATLHRFLADPDALPLPA